MQKKTLYLHVLLLPGFFVISEQFCGDPGEIENGWRVGSNFKFAQTIIYHCNEGHDLVGNGVLTCGADWRWSNSLPDCVPVKCPPIRSPSNGRIIGYGRTYGTRLQIRCNTGYKAVGSTDRQCEADQMWSGRETMCQEIDCGWPTIWNGYLIGHSTTVGSRITYVCTAGGMFHSRVTAKCLDSGRWSAPPPDCYAHCRVPSIPDALVFGGREGIMVAHGTVVQFNCNGNLTLNDTSSVICRNGSWTHIPSCVPVSCPVPPPQIDNGILVFLGQRHGDKARYICSSGHYLRGYDERDRNVRCHFGKWVGEAPACNPSYCNYPGSVLNGRIRKITKYGIFDSEKHLSQNRHGDRLEFVCDYGYQVRGPSGAVCVNGEWQPNVDTVWKCIKTLHPVFPRLWLPLEERYS